MADFFKRHKAVHIWFLCDPRMLPSNCWRARMKRMKYRHLIGLSSRIRKALGMAPRKGPKKGMTLVTPTTTLTRGA